MNGRLRKMGINITEMYVDDEIRQAAIRILDGKRYIKGPEVKQFENEFAEFCGVGHATATSSGTTALMTAYLALGLGQGDEVIVPSHTFIATATPAVVLGAKPVFVDIDPETYTMDVDDVKSKITEKTKCIVPVHIYGHPVDMAPLMEIASERDIPVIEDSCQAHGGLYRDQKIGSIGTMACFSFFPSKNMTVAGDGGIVISKDKDLGEKLGLLRDHGRTDKYTSSMLGLNFRMSEIHAAIGRIQLKHLPEWIEQRRRAAETYNKLLEGVEQVTRPVERDWAKHVYHLYVIQIDDRDGLAEYLKSKGIGTGIHYAVPLHGQPILAKFVEGIELPVTDSVTKRILSLPLHPELSDEDIGTVTDEIKNFVKNK
jgi:dTDP-4-amino-4,6-dideoxygalactose transaminase